VAVTQTEINKLEEKVNLLSKAMYLILFEKQEAISKKETKEIEKRLASYLKGNKSEFVNLEDVMNAGRKNTQKRTKRS
jgi:hypothetical protein